MGYTHEFTIAAEDMPIVHGIEEFANSLTIRFEMGSCGGEEELEEWECVSVDSDHAPQYVGICIDINYGETKFDDAIKEACWREWGNIIDGWAGDAAEYRAEQAMEPSCSDERITDMGMDVPAR